MKRDYMSRLKKFYKLVMPAFKLVSRQMKKGYKSAFSTLHREVDIDEETTVLDVGTGTGGLASLFLEYTSHITGIDFSPDMIKEARKKYGDRIDFLEMPAHELSDFDAAEFDLVAAAYALHDMDNEYRRQVLEEMRRVADNKVVIFDFVKNYNPIVWVVETLEGSFYWDFVNSIDDQLNRVFPDYEKIKVDKRMGLYICEI